MGCCFWFVSCCWFVVMFGVLFVLMVESEDLEGSIIVLKVNDELLFFVFG